MPEVHADPDKLKQVAKTLTSSANQLQEMSRTLSRVVDGAVGRDAEMQKFQQEFNQALKVLTSFSTTLKDGYAPRLQKKAAALEEFQRH